MIEMSLRFAIEEAKGCNAVLGGWVDTTGSICVVVTWDGS